MSDLNLILNPPACLNPEGVAVRTAGTQADPLFCLADVCKVLSISDVGQVAGRIDEDDRCQARAIDSMGREQQSWFVTESGLYAVLLRSDKPQAKPFRKWVCGEVLPCIRRHGCYPAPSVPPAGPIDAASIRGMVSDAVRTALRESAPELRERVPDIVYPREFIRACWPECPQETQAKIVRRMERNYRDETLRLCPTVGDARTAPVPAGLRCRGPMGVVLESGAGI